ncbi:B and T lymphocyte associated [Phyllostomus discolor]|uniref:B and T lymphocyte associated n=1 Tax=Phyllostomus discolor TaxID=89673 RepID=A0A7E6D3W8_9CHIR|nr:B- and T-lymphocyte attenuator isoform X1 [Phyllostomus discolor]KAF6117629.1 B and T lymphocyte associated [Phyllostomus discolor]
MKTSPAMLGIGKSFWVLFLIPHLGIWSIDGEKSCDPQIYIQRDSVHTALTGKSFHLECPVDICANIQNATWCKIEGENCPPLGQTSHIKMKWDERENTRVYLLYFDQAQASDNGSYRCSANVSSGLLESYSITLYVTEQTQNNSEYLLINTTSASGPPSKNKTEDRQLILYSLAPLGGLPLLITGFCLFCCRRRHRGEQKKASETAERGINVADVPQPSRSEQTEVCTRQNSQNLTLETEVYDNDPWFGVQEEPKVYSNLCLEENKQSIVYASLNHSIIKMNPRQAKNMEEAPTEYAAICVRS